MALIDTLEKEDIQVIGIIREVSRKIGSAEGRGLKEEVKAKILLEARQLLDLAQKILYKEELGLKKEKKLIKTLEKEARDFIAAAEA